MKSQVKFNADRLTNTANKRAVQKGNPWSWRNSYGRIEASFQPPNVPAFIANVHSRYDNIEAPLADLAEQGEANPNFVACSRTDIPALLHDLAVIKLAHKIACDWNVHGVIRNSEYWVEKAEHELIFGHPKKGALIREKED